MCGISGVINASRNIVPEYNGFIRDAILAGAVRGTDSIGVGQIDAKIKRLVQKGVLSADDFLKTAAVKKMVNDADASYVTVVHHRAATIGHIKPEAAQPFANWDSADNKYQPLTVHNGTLTHYNLNVSKTGPALTNDSEWLAYMIAASIDNDDGLLDFDKTFGVFQGAFSVVTAIGGRCYMANNGERPMYVAFTEDESGVLFASEAGMLYWLAERNKITFKDSKIIQLEKDKVYVFDFMDTTDKVVVSVHDYIKAAPVAPVISYGKGTWKDYAVNSFIEFYKDITGQSPQKPAVQLQLPPPPRRPGNGANKLKGLTVEFAVTQFDANTKTAFGIGWPASPATTGDPAADAVLADGNVMFVADAVTEGDLLGAGASTVFTGKVLGVRVIQETVADGSKKRVSYMVLDKRTVEVVEPAYAS